MSLICLPHEEGHTTVSTKHHVAVWYDREGDFLKVVFEQREGYFRETTHEQVMAKVDKDGAVIGFHVLQVSRLTHPLDVALVAADGTL